MPGIMPDITPGGMSGARPQLPKLDTRRDVVQGWEMFSRFCIDANQDHPPVVMVHGLSMSSRYMVPTAQRLASTYRVFAPDLPGYGKSQKPDKTLPIEDLARQLGLWMDQMGIGPAVLVGNSMGCQIIVEFALQNPGRVTKAVLIGPTMDPRTRSLARVFPRGVWNMRFEPLSFFLVLFGDYLRAGVRETFQALSFAIHDPVEEKVQRIHVPVLVTRGEKDKIVSQAWVDELARRLPNAQVSIIPGGAHVANFDAPDRMAERIHSFIYPL